MLLTLSTTHQPATDLGYLLHKHPGRAQSFELAFGTAQVFYPEVSETRCTAALLIEISPVSLMREKAQGSFTLDGYVNDRPYVASSFLSVAIAQVFGTALNGTSKSRPELAATAIPLEAQIPAIPARRGGADLLRRLFEPLGYEVQADQLPLDPSFPDWGPSRYFSLRLRGEVRLADLLTHLYVLIPVLDQDKHYYTGKDEIDKLMQKGESWLAAHPERALITQRFLRYRRSLISEAMERLTTGEVTEEAAEDEASADQEEVAVERRISLHERRLAAVTVALKEAGAARVLDLGCGEGKLIGHLLKDPQFNEIVGVDASHWVLERAAQRLNFERMPPAQRKRVTLLQGALTYRDDRLLGFDAAALVEVIEHLDPPRLKALERVLFGVTRPGLVLITTPNVEYNVRFESLPAGKFRHRDHRFEWSRAEFEAWGSRVAAAYGYTASFGPVGDVDEEVGAPSQMGVFRLKGES